MSIHKLTAGSGYDYLTRQVAAHDVTEKGHAGLASYYTAKGEAPGRWVGAGMAGIDGLAAGDVVTAEQMQALFGSGHHPLAAQRRDQLQGPDLTDRNYQSVTRLGVPYKVYARDVSAFRLEVAQRIAELNISRGVGGSAAREVAVSVQERARIRTEVAVEFFRNEHGRDPADAREIAATIAKNSRPRTTAVAGYDLTFSPVKSVVDAVGGRRPRHRGTHRAGPPGRGERCADVPGRARPVHQAGHQRGPPGQRPGTRGHRLHTS